MNKLLSWVAGVTITAVVVIGASVDAWAAADQQKRVALVVGNSNYKSANISLLNPRNDAEDVSKVLKDLGFEVVSALDATKRDMDFALQRFARLATDADAALFFYAGHAMQFQGRNFLMPTDAELEDDISVRYQTISLEEVRAALDRANNAVRIMILDACRNNPLAARLQNVASRGINMTRGLARIDKTQGMVVAYATAADEVADDGQGRNSPFTTALLKRLQEPGLEIEMMFRRVASDVNVQTGGRQRPETYISLLSEYYLNQSDRIVWDRIKEQDDIASLRDFISKYPSSPHAIFARNRLDLLERYAREREEEARRNREEERRKAAEAEAQKVARENALRREIEESLRAEQLAAQKRVEDEQKRREAARQEAARQEAARQEALRQEALRQQQIAEQKRQEDLRRQQEEQRQLAILQQQEEQKRKEAERQQQDEQTRLALQQQDEQKRLAAVKQQEEQKRLAALKQQEEQKRKEAERQQQDEQTRLAALQQQEEQKRQEADRQRAEQQRLAALKQQEEQKRRQDAERQQQADLDRKRIEDNCHREEAKLAELQAAGAAARGQLVKFEIEVGCKALRPMITAALAALPADAPRQNALPPATKLPDPAADQQAAKANILVEQIRRAQTELMRLGCFKGNVDGKMNRETRNAVKAFWTRSHKPVVEIGITDELIADLEQQHDPVCNPAPDKQREASRPRTPHGERAAQHETKRPAQREATSPAAAPPVASSPPPSTRATAGATPSPGNARAIGTGF